MEPSVTDKEDVARSKEFEEGSSTWPVVNKEEFVSALGQGRFLRWATPLYQTVVDVFCRDDYVKSLLLEQIEGENQQILDIACGTGKLVRLLALKQTCCQVTGMDIDPGMVARAQATTKDLDNVTILQGNCTKTLPFEDASIDIVVESLVFHHLSDEEKAKAAQEIARVLQPETGRFYFVDWIKPSGSYAKTAFRVIEIVDGADNVRAHGTGQVLSMIQEASGLELSTVPTVVQTSFGTLGIVAFKHSQPHEQEQEPEQEPEQELSQLD